jgi:hypothetical protein
VAEGLILEFEGYSVDDYRQAATAMGLDMDTGEGPWPEGLVSHTAAVGENGLVVFEVWRSQADQERFMAERLGAALAATGVDGPPKRSEWLELNSHHERPEQG